MNTLRIISSIFSLLIFLVIVYIAFIAPDRDKERAYESSFSGKVISTLETEGRGKRVISITVEILNDHSRCFVLISPVERKKLYPQYLDSIFKKSNSDIIYLKKDQSNEIVKMDGIDCLSINCREEN